MSKPDAPTPPDPKQTAAASTGTNVATALANASLNNVNQIGPNGSLMYSQTGSSKFTDPYTGQTYDIPNYTQTTTLSPDQQKLYDLNNQTQQNLGQIGVDQSSKIGTLLNTPFDPATANKAVEDKIDALGAARLDPQFAKEQDALNTQLANQGIQIGSQAWKNAMTQFQQGKNDAYNQLYLGGNQQAFQQALTTRNQPINEITALMSGSQVSNPTFGATPQTTIPTTDTAGIINSSYNQQLQNYQLQQQQQNALLGGLFGLGAGALSNPALKFSDRRLKKDIKKIGKTNKGQNLYSYKYKGSGEPQIGLMAQEVEKEYPDAVITTPSGYKAVNYDKALGLVEAA
jgi:hypothetical protein